MNAEMNLWVKVYVTVTSVEIYKIAVCLWIFSKCTMYKHTSWWWTIICSKHLEDNLIKKKNKPKCAYCWSFSCVCITMHSSENVYFELFLLQKYVGVVCYLLKFIWWADIFSPYCIAIISEKQTYTTISEKLTTFHDSYKHLHFEKPIGAAICEQQYSY